jgi:catechol 2,3-dioxygenase-like lactoylglutathione lyase family enzyme
MTPAPPFLSDTALICLVCTDIDTTVRRCKDVLGIGPWQAYDFIPPLQHDTKLRGKDEPYTMRVAFGAVGGIGWSFLEPKSGASIYREFLTSRGAGMHHAAFLHAGLSYREAIAEFEKRGFPMVQQGSYCGRYCYFDTRDRAHMIFELVEDPEAIMQGLVYRYPDRVDPRAPAPVFDATRAIGLVTADLNETLSAYGALGIGPWIVDESEGPDGVRRAHTQLGRCALELVQPGRGNSIYSEFLDRRGPRVHHLTMGHGALGYHACKAQFAARDIAAIGETRHGDRRACYLETEPILGLRLRITD